MLRSDKTSILIVLIAGIGDMILASKGLRAIRQGFPNAEIHLLTSSDAAPFARNYPYLDRVWPFPIRELRTGKRSLLQILNLVNKLRRIDFTVLLNLYRVTSFRGALKMGLLFTLLKARKKVGHANKGFQVFLNVKAPANTFQDTHLAEAMLNLVSLAGGIPDEKGIEVFFSEEAEKEWEKPISKIEKRKIGINPGADKPHKRWKPEGYALVADRLIGRYDTEIILLGGPGEEYLADEIQRKMRHDVTNLCGKLTLDDLVYVISRLDLLITNDSGPMHIAAAVKTPVVAIFGPEDPVYTRPYTSADLYRIVHKEVDCRPCKRKKCREPRCLDLATPEEVFEKCVEILVVPRNPSSNLTSSCSNTPSI